METYINELNLTENFIDEDTSKKLFFSLLKEIPWMSFDWNNNIDFHSYMYGSFERDLVKKESLEDLITLVETAIETDVLRLRCRLYKNGEYGMSVNRSEFNNNTIHLFLGTSRKLIIESNRKKTVFSMKNNSILLVSSEENTRNTFFSVKKNKRIKSPSIHICFCINNPYKYRIYNKCTVHLLGYGNIVIDYDKKTYPECIKDKTIIAVVYSDNVGGLAENNNGIYLPGAERLFRPFES